MVAERYVEIIPNITMYFASELPSIYLLMTKFLM